MKGIPLQQRFSHCTQPLFSIMAMTGVYLEPIGPRTTWKTLSKRLWSILWLIFCVQGSIFIVFKHFCPIKSFFTCGAHGGFSGELAIVLLRLSELVCDTVVHVTLIFTIESTITSFLKILEPVDNDLKRPSLWSVKRLTVIGLIYLMTTVSYFYIFKIDLIKQN